MNDKIKKNKGPIRFEAIIPVAILSALTFGYFSFYFDIHMKNLFEYIGTQANGAEVNIDSIKTSFIRGSFTLNKLQITNPEKPSLNSLEIEKMHFKYLWDALLRMKFVVEDASISNVQISKPRKSVGKVLPPSPAKPSKLEGIQDQIISQVKNRYHSNMLGDVLSILEGTNYQDQLDKIRQELKSEQKIKSMIKDVDTKKQFWEARVKVLSDLSNIKEIESTLASVKKEKNFLNQIQGAKKLTDQLGKVNSQYKEIENSSKQLRQELKEIANYPNQIKTLVEEDITSLKSRFSIPSIDFKDLALQLFSSEFSSYIVQARKYQALAEQYIPEKKDPEKVVIPPKRSEGKNYTFPITTGYPLFWLKRAAISSKGTSNSYSGNVSGELTNVTTSPKLIRKPIVLELKGDFPSAKIMGVTVLGTLDFTREISKQSAVIQVNSFSVPKKLFIDDEKIKFGFQSAIGSTNLKVELENKNILMNWTSTLNKPQFLVETSNKIAKSVLNNIVNNIPLININGSATGTFSNLNIGITSNLGDELSLGLKREVGSKIAEAEGKIKSLIDEKIKLPQQNLMTSLNKNTQNLNTLNGIQDFYKKNENRIREEIEKLKKGGSATDLKEKGKKLLKGIKF